MDTLDRQKVCDISCIDTANPRNSSLKNKKINYSRAQDWMLQTKVDRYPIGGSHRKGPEKSSLGSGSCNEVKGIWIEKNDRNVLEGATRKARILQLEARRYHAASRLWITCIKLSFTG